MGGQVTSLKGLLSKLEKARDDDEVRAVVVTFDATAMGLAQRQEVRAALMQIKDAGKPVYVFAEAMSMPAYACSPARPN